MLLNWRAGGVGFRRCHVHSGAATCRSFYTIPLLSPFSGFNELTTTAAGLWHHDKWSKRSGDFCQHIKIAGSADEEIALPNGRYQEE